MDILLDVYAPLAAFLAPTLALALLNGILAMAGERGTLLLPTGAVYARGARRPVPEPTLAERPKAVGSLTPRARRRRRLQVPACQPALA
jgi:hypothetical protein